MVFKENLPCRTCYGPAKEVTKWERKGLMCTKREPVVFRGRAAVARLAERICRSIGNKKAPVSRGLKSGAGEEGRTPDLMLGKHRKKKSGT